MSVSVIIPTWNRSAALELAIQSALSQTYPPLEVLVCDDGSTDDTEQVVRSINDPRVVWLPGVRSGRPAIPRNRGIRLSRGEWIAFLDDDDVWLPNKLAIQLEMMMNLNCRACCSNALSNELAKGTNVYKLGWDGHLLTFWDLLRGNRVICSSALVHRDLMDKADEFPEAVKLASIEDYAFWLRIGTFTDFAFVSAPLVSYTDLPQTSIRAAGLDAWKQKRIVLGNFLAWGVKNRISADYLREAIYAYFAALKVQVNIQMSRYKERMLKGNML